MRWIAVIGGVIGGVIGAGGGAAGLTACGASHQGFHPAERATAETITGETAADYEIVTEAGSMGDVKLWSRGAFETDDGTTVIHIGIQLENESSRPIVLDDVVLDSLRYDGAVKSNIRPTGQLARVLPGKSEEFELYFTLPEPADPDRIRAFRVRWKAQAGDSTYQQTTPFHQDRERMYAGMPYSYYYYSPYYDPFYDPFWVRPYPIAPPVP
ncbi:MAG: hypothetical protein ACOC1F_05135 [Myxococcota bacterium]